MSLRSWLPGWPLPFLLLGVAVLAACGGVKTDPILQLSAAEALEEGKALMAEKKYHQARKYLIHAYEVEPNSRTGREGLLLAADALFFQDSSSSYIEAESRYRDFLNRFPTSDQASYAQFQIARCLSQRIAKPDRDQESARKALREFQDVIRLYPTSPYAAEAREEMKVVTENLAAHEYEVGAFYMRFGLPSSAVKRFERLLEEYPDYPERDKVLFRMCEAYERLEQPENAAEACKRLREEYPESRYVEQVRDKLEDLSDEEGSAAADDVATNGRL